MYEWHGWATIVASPGTEDDEAADARQRAAEAEVGDLVAAAGAVNETVDLRRANGSLHLWLAGAHNHRDDGVVELFAKVAQLAPGSYGVLYALEHGVDPGWHRWVMRRGKVTGEADSSLSPHVGSVEDR
ncbi:Imm7 family immunity protein [Kribbella sp. NPDC050124]|uniref:Imm7 family immunity protein n=1 Tax=Kribbella sp. NPDC050124 TaxID=3364114 RepID=UPI00379E8D5C